VKQILSITHLFPSRDGPEERRGGEGKRQYYLVPSSKMRHLGVASNL